MQSSSVGQVENLSRWKRSLKKTPKLKVSQRLCAEKPVSRLWAVFIQVSKHKRAVENVLLECVLTRH